MSAALAVCAGACTSDHYSRRSERQAHAILAQRHDEVLGAREAEALVPAPALVAPPEEALPDGLAAAPDAPPLVLDLQRALALAYATNRDMLARREGLELQALSLSNSRHTFAPQLALALSYLLDENPRTDDLESAAARFSATQILATGAILRLDAASAGAEVGNGDPLYDSLIAVSLAQPLLRGGGYEVSHEPLIQAERNLVYALREFELFREDFSIDVARRYYDLVNRKQSIENQLRNLENNTFGRNQAEALFAVGRANELDVLRARRSELTARNGLLEAEEGLQLALDTFRIFLGLPEDQPIDVLPAPPDFTVIAFDLRSALEVARENRLDLRNREEQVEDVERGLRVARNALLPDLNLVLGAAYGTETTDSLGGGELDRTDATLALTFGVPLDRVRERNAYRANELLLARARRELDEFEDRLAVSIKSSFRELARRLESLEIQRQLIQDQTKNLRIAELRFEQGDLPNRDVVEANQSLLDAQNALIDEQVGYEIARLQLLRELGILFVGEDGMWKA
jgi:outer membrane protein TolC